MENIIAERVKGVALTKAQRKIAEYFIQNQGKIGSLSSMDVAKEIGVSDASIIRFSRAIGFEGYADLKNHIYNMLLENTYGNLSLSERLSKNSAKYSGASTPARFQEVIQQNIDSVFRDNRTEDFEHVINLIVSSNHKYVVGMRGCRGIALQFGRLLSFMLSGVQILTDGECTSINSLQDIQAGDVLIMYAFSRFYKVDLSYVKLAREHSAKVCLITNELTGPLTSYADEVLRIASANMSFYHSTVAVTMAYEYILNMVSNRVDYQARIEQSDEITEYQRL